GIAPPPARPLAPHVDGRATAVVRPSPPDGRAASRAENLSPVTEGTIFFATEAIPPCPGWGWGRIARRFQREQPETANNRFPSTSESYLFPTAHMRVSRGIAWQTQLQLRSTNWPQTWPKSTN